MKKVIVIVGPTASGKTNYSVKLAKHFNGEIINGDSVQIYKELNIGSAKIKEEEKNGVSHHLFDVASIFNEYSVFNFQKDVRKIINEIKTPFLVGGTGFYIKAALYDYEFNNEEDNETFDELTNEMIYQELIKVDPKIAIDQMNRHRLVRALNQAKSGNYRSSKKNKDVPLYDILTIYLDIERDKLKERLHERLEIQLRDGFIDEVKLIKDKNKKLNVIGYRELDSYLDGEISLEDAKTAIIKVSMNLAKKQKTWFKNQMKAHIFNPLNENSFNEMKTLISSFLKEKQWEYI